MSSANLIARLSLLRRHSRLVSSGSSGSTHTRAKLVAEVFMCETLAMKLGLIQAPNNA